MPVLTSANLASAMVKLVAVDALSSLVENLLIANLVQRDFRPTLSQVGEEVNLCTSLSAPPKKVILDTFTEVSFAIPDITKVIAVPELLKLYMNPAILALANRVDYDILSLCRKFRHVSRSLPSENVSLAPAVMDLYLSDVSADLAASGVRPTQPKFYVLNPEDYRQLRYLPRFSEYPSSQTAGLELGIPLNILTPVGMLGDFYVFQSPYIVKRGGFAFTKKALGIAIRRIAQPILSTGVIAEYAETGGFGIQVSMNYIPTTLAQMFTLKILYGVAVLDETQGAQVLP